MQPPFTPTQVVIGGTAALALIVLVMRLAVSRL